MWLFYVLFFLYGIVIGSFLNVVIYRVPKHENIVKIRSHCMNCGYQLRWYDLIPLFSWIMLGGKCRKCKQPISVQYPLVEAVNGVFYMLVFWKYGLSVEAVLYCLLISALLAIAVIDFRTFEIPPGLNWFIAALGAVRLLTDLDNWKTYLLGLVIISVPLIILFFLSRGGAIGGGDVKLMAAAGLLLGWQLALLAFLLGCVFGSVIHVIRMRLTDADRTLAMGPYLAAGIITVVFFGQNLIDWYLGSFL